MDNTYAPLLRALDECLRFSLKGKIHPASCPVAEDSDHTALLLNPDGTFNDTFMGNPDIHDGKMTESVWKDSEDPRVFVYADDGRKELC